MNEKQNGDFDNLGRNWLSECNCEMKYFMQCFEFDYF